ncbi:hypothetical protein AK88_02079 [Plasmodium fragile]|uniref:Uncharacterized protein n=1 Tax=Plasmodium fragile TaxID=5857 RepID=A0A0D9QMZ4_PLAFR|nr:uncharacterized protein AK88_02079 [Plasmodium fragile]KJP88298.1 hypothetical protein AK88_02079 [Plasmodium fragile]
MKMTTLCNIAILTILLSKVVHIVLIKFASRKESGKFSASTFWTFFKNSEDGYKRKILTEQEDYKDDFLMDFIIDNNVTISDSFLSLVDTRILDNIDVRPEDITESLSMDEDTEKEQKRMYRECCKLLGKACNDHKIASKNSLTKEKTEAATVEKGKKEVEETPKKTRRRTIQSTTPSRYSKRIRRRYFGKRLSESEEHDENTEEEQEDEEVLVPKVPERTYGNIFLTNFEKEMAKKQCIQLLGIHSYRNKTYIKPDISKHPDPGISNIPSDNEQLGKNKPSIESNVECGKDAFLLQYDDIICEVRSEGSVDDKDSEENNNEEDSEENTDNEDSDNSENSVSSHELWSEYGHELDIGSDTETSSETLEQEIESLKYH